MPEGPEVKRCGDIITKFQGKKVLQALSMSDRGKFKDFPEISLDDVTILDVHTRGKMIAIKFDNGYTAISTLGMTGWWYPPVDQLEEDVRNRKVYYLGKMVTAGDVIAKALRSARFKLVLSGRRELIYCDQRNFGNFAILPDKLAEKRINSLGVDVLDEAFSYSYPGSKMLAIVDKYKNKYPEKEVGEALLDQNFVSGIGNIYRAETLYIAGVLPHRKLSSLSAMELKSIIFIACHVLNVAYKTESSMEYDPMFICERIKNDELQSRFGRGIKDWNMKIPGHLVYGRSHDIFGHEVKNDSVGGRTSWYVPEVQT